MQLTAIYCFKKGKKIFYILKELILEFKIFPIKDIPIMT